MLKTTLLEGGIHTDSRGILKFVNDPDPGTYRRFYLISHPDTSVVRAWQGHRIDEKAFYVLSGRLTVAVVQPQPDCFDTPSDSEIPEIFDLTEESGHFLRVPGGCYTGIKAHTPGATLLVLSSLDLAHSKEDDYRQPSHRWVNWNNIC